MSGVSAVGPSLSLNGQSLGSTSNSVSVGLATIGPYVDYYPDPTGGFHVLATVGFVSLSASNGDQQSNNSGSGFGLGAGVGYDFWVSDDWSLGVLGRFTWASTTVDSGGLTVTDSLIAPAVLFSVAYQ